MLAVAFTIVNIVNTDDNALDVSEVWRQKSAKLIKWLYPSVIVLTLALIFTPTTKDAFLIYGVGGTIDYIKTDETAKQIPHKIVVALDKCLEYITPEDRKDQ